MGQSGRSEAIRSQSWEDGKKGIGGARLKLCLDGGHLETTSGPKSPDLSKINQSSWDPELGALESCWCVAGRL